MTKREVYQVIKDKILADVQEVESVELWRGQTVNTSEEHPFPFPSVFVEFTKLPYETLRGSLESVEDAQIVLHIVDKALTPEQDLDILDLSEIIAGVMIEAQFTRRQENQATTPGYLPDWRILFDVPYYQTDPSESLEKYRSIAKPPPILTEQES